MTATDSPPIRRPTMRRSRHEHRILRSIGDGANIDDLLKSPKWTVDDVAWTLQRYDLTVTEDGRVVRKPPVQTELRHIAEHSPSPHVRRHAAAAVEQMQRLRAALDDQTRTTTWEAEKARQRQALEMWRRWLKTAHQEVSAEIRRLRPRLSTSTADRRD